jgi:hypothetical protein
MIPSDVQNLIISFLSERDLLILCLPEQWSTVAFEPSCRTYGHNPTSLRLHRSKDNILIHFERSGSSMETLWSDSSMSLENMLSSDSYGFCDCRFTMLNLWIKRSINERIYVIVKEL